MTCSINDRVVVTTKHTVRCPYCPRWLSSERYLKQHVGARHTLTRRGSRELMPGDYVIHKKLGPGVIGGGRFAVDRKAGMALVRLENVAKEADWYPLDELVLA